MHDTRLAVLETIRSQGQATVVSLAEALGISPISIRHHLTSLQAEGVVRVELQRQAVGRPKHIYSLTDAAARYFPNTYRALAERLMDELKATLSPEQLELIIDRMAANAAAKYGALQIRGSLELRLQKLVDILGEEGFMAAVRRLNNTTFLAEVSCPYVHVGPRESESCRIDDKIIRSALGANVQRMACVLHGDRSCIFHVEDNSAVSAG